MKLQAGVTDKCPVVYSFPDRDCIYIYMSAHVKPVVLWAHAGDKECQDDTHLRIPLANKKVG